jgi:hypothetical protein
MIFKSGGMGDSADNVTAGNGNDILLLAPNSQLIAGNGVDKVHANQNDTITLGNGGEMGIGTVTLRFMMDELRATPGNYLTNGFPTSVDVAAVHDSA